MDSAWGSKYNAKGEPIEWTLRPDLERGPEEGVRSLFAAAASLLLLMQVPL